VIVTEYRGATAADELITGLDADGSEYPIGKLEAHRRNTRHRAVSIFIFDGERLLLQQRAKAKYHSGGLWANSCCSHPRWGEAAAACASRRLQEELGFSVPLQQFAIIEYSSPVGSGLFENELVHCFRGTFRAGTDLSGFNTAEVQDVAWRGHRDLAAELLTDPHRYAAWLRIYLERHADRAQKFAIWQ
jgi:isopentenyl-diphosphate delta-isomerase